VDFDEAYAHLSAKGPGRMVPDLSRITELASLLGDPQLAYPSIHVTGTNGKSSVTRMTATLLSALGLTAGTYTSPHLQTVRERFTVAGRFIGEQRFGEIYDEVARLADFVDNDLEARGKPDRITYFELLTAMAYWWFADVPVDIGVFEVGMGGTWDATNLIRGEVAILTPIDIDHMQQLGNKPEVIAKEKAGIIKPGSAVVVGRQSDAVMAVIAQAADLAGATVSRWGTDHDVVSRRVAVGGQYIALRVGDRVIDEIMLPLHGSHQADNAALALAAVAAFLPDGFARVDDALIRQAFLAVVSPGRLEIVHREPTVVLDGAHNPHGARTSAAALTEAFEFRHLVLVLAVLEDKDVEGIVAAYADVANHVIVTEAPSGRTAGLARIHEAATVVWEGTGVAVETAKDIDEALALATGIAGEGDGILVTGSLYTVGAARDIYLQVTDTGDEVVYEPADLTEEEEEAEFQRAIDEMIDRVDEAALTDPDD